jgi:maltooligosyltrehalose trehalohydrolase
MMFGRKHANQQRRLPIGAEVQPGGGVHFRVWSPRRRQVQVVLPDTGERICLDAEPEGYFSGIAPRACAGQRYGYQLDDEPRLYPDPASRSQPEGPHGHSEIIDPSTFEWQDEHWKGVSLKGQVLYELHIGTFSPEGTWCGALVRLPHLVDLGVTLIEVMPIAEFAGTFGWGYDGVDLFAPTRLYGRPDDFRRFVDAAHLAGLGVVLDVVYNHFGPAGNYVGQYSTHYLSQKYQTDWGDAINFDADDCRPVREMMLSNAGYWIDEFHVDGLRLDAVHALIDDSEDHLLAAMARHVRKMAGSRKTLLFAENELQHTRLLRPADRQGYGLDAAWNDDFHHAARVAMTGHNEYYYGDYRGTPQELISAVKWGYLYQGQWNARQRRQRGTPGLDLAAEQFVNFLQNHDQIGNSPRGLRIHALTSPGRLRAMTALWALAPGTPLIFQGQEFAASAPFLFFADHEPELSQRVREGRMTELRHFRSLAGGEGREYFDDPCEVATFEKCKLDWSELAGHAAIYALHRDLLRLRRDDAVFSAQRADRIHGAVIADEAFVLRYFGEAGDDRLLLVNLGRDLEWRPMAEPLLVPPAGSEWRLLWSSDSPRYGGLGTAPLDPRNWYLSGHAALVLTSAGE